MTSYNLISIGSVNPLAPGRCQKCCRNLIFKCIFWYIYLMDFHWNWSGELATVLKSALVQVMAWCRQATSHNLNQCWLMFLSPYGVGQPQWVNGLSPVQHQAITSTIAELISTGLSGTNFTQISIQINKINSRKWTFKCRLQNVSHFVQTSRCDHEAKTKWLTFHRWHFKVYIKKKLKTFTLWIKFHKNVSLGVKLN